MATIWSEVAATVLPVHSVLKVALIVAAWPICSFTGPAVSVGITVLVCEGFGLPLTST